MSIDIGKCPQRSERGLSPELFVLKIPSSDIPDSIVDGDERWRVPISRENPPFRWWVLMLDDVPGGGTSHISRNLKHQNLHTHTQYLQPLDLSALRLLRQQQQQQQQQSHNSPHKA
ncbi:uncharacterized protein BO95DRAFT_461335 [Aspergillus brunneoviolaceus CBS 621.78]|uniref:Uncharacterized protein n=1 Tax=Aspergillus brunneoviolaceus CBS 621.78 TaxID=1450534 RepID=A0ACD1GG16_9EURO|nr:hypothetical protein BO95DRAFT_461335 [Aspergillus brunneoviolaceus CBS 621.78]RAH48254.1 hypothetical protein BO95DRAFT_461335 [Aspergillus brunneoviolaceus CBS 621.78]